VLAQLVVVIIVEAFHRRVLDRPVPLPGNGLPANRERDAFDLAVRPGVARQVFACKHREGMSDFCEPVFDLMRAAGLVKDVPIMICELDAIIGEHDEEPAGHGGDQVA